MTKVRKRRRGDRLIAAIAFEQSTQAPDKMVALRAAVESLHALTDHSGLAMHCAPCRNAVNEFAANHTRRHSRGE